MLYLGTLGINQATSRQKVLLWLENVYPAVAGQTCTIGICQTYWEERKLEKSPQLFKFCKYWSPAYLSIGTPVNRKMMILPAHPLINLAKSHPVLLWRFDCFDNQLRISHSAAIENPWRLVSSSSLFSLKRSIRKYYVAVADYLELLSLADG